MKMVAGARLTRAQQRIVAHAPVRGEDRRGAAVGRADDDGAAAEATDEGAAPAPGAAAGEEGALPRALGRPRALRRAQHERQQGEPSARGASKQAARRRGRRSRRSAARAASTSARRGAHGGRRTSRASTTGSTSTRRASSRAGSSPASRRASSTRCTSSSASSRAPSRSGSTSSGCCRSATRRPTGPRRADASGGDVGPSEFLFEPNQRALLERLVPMYVEISLYRALLESQASFFGAQMTAMDAATRNAKEMIARLTLVVQPRAPGGDHEGADGDHRRRRGAQGLVPPAAGFTGGDH